MTDTEIKNESLETENYELSVDLDDHIARISSLEKELKTFKDLKFMQDVPLIYRAEVVQLLQESLSRCGILNTIEKLK